MFEKWKSEHLNCISYIPISHDMYFIEFRIACSLKPKKTDHDH